MPWPPKEPRECAECHATVILHAKGLCVNCYHRANYQGQQYTCSDCGRSVKKVTSGQCGSCYQRTYRLNHPERVAEYQRAYLDRGENRDRHNERNREYYAARKSAREYVIGPLAQEQRVRQLYEEPLDETPSERRCRLRRERNGE